MKTHQVICSEIEKDRRPSYLLPMRDDQWWVRYPQFKGHFKKEIKRVVDTHPPQERESWTPTHLRESPPFYR
jgi:hypothetical protein